MERVAHLPLATSKQESEDVFTSPVSGPLAQRLWAAAGREDPGGAVLLLLLLTFSIYWPIHIVQVRQLWGKATQARSDLMFGVLLSVAVPVWTIATGGLAGQHALVWLESCAFVCLAIAVIAVKYWLLPASCMLYGLRRAVWYAICVHGLLGISMASTVARQFLMRDERTPLEFVDFLIGGVGCAQVFMLATIGLRYGFSVQEHRNGLERHGRSNLTPIFVLAYTLWHAAFECSTHPQSAGLVLTVTLILPLVVAATTQSDWLEVRIHAFLNVLTLRLAPHSINGPILAPFFLQQDFFLSSTLHLVLAVLALLVTLVLVWEVLVLVVAERGHFEFGCLTQNFLIDEYHTSSFYADTEHGSRDREVFAYDV